jgi:hypothetical protein
MRGWGRYERLCGDCLLCGCQEGLRMSLMGRFEPLRQVDRPTAVLTTADADAFDGSSLRVRGRSPRSTGRLQPATSCHPRDQEIGIRMNADGATAAGQRWRLERGKFAIAVARRFLALIHIGFRLYVRSSTSAPLTHVKRARRTRCGWAPSEKGRQRGADSHFRACRHRNMSMPS